MNSKWHRWAVIASLGLTVMSLPALLTASEAEFLPSTYVPRAADDPCPPGQKTVYVVGPTDGDLVPSGCEPLAPDAGAICATSSECVHDCLTSLEDMQCLSCSTEACQHTGSACPVVESCPGIRGRCAATQGESFLVIHEPGQVLCKCQGI